MKLYHATFGPLMNDILRDGLIAGGVDIQNFSEIQKGVYLGSKPEFCESMVEASENENIPEDWFGDYVIFEIDVSKLDLTKLIVDPNLVPDEELGEVSYLYLDSIPADALSLFDYE